MKLPKNYWIHLAQIFKEDRTQQLVMEAGEKIFLKLLKLDDESLEKAQMRIFHVAVSKGSVRLGCKKLPPTSATAAQHSWQ